MKKSILLISLITSFFSFSQDNYSKEQKIILDNYYTNGALNYNYNYQMFEWQKCLDEGLAKDNSIARLWSEKAMPYFKARKYEMGMPFIDKAVELNPKEYLPYRAFLKCIFSKNYKDAIKDFEESIKLNGNSYEMDHTYNFYIGLSYLQLNEYSKAEKLFKEYIDELFEKRQGLENSTAYFYYGISLYEQKNWQEAIVTFDKAIKQYPNFSEAKYYKAICLARLGKQDEVKKVFQEAQEDFKKGCKLSEWNTVYEMYPYEISPYHLNL
ncbi:tetratricopeptide repeat protein [Flavobacterium sp. SUN052]|uniref:tetratricopeptide repeat protein n=1 Tax=Flavobacterium sp. SUN052 TaxID=3002441 RepID=UPI00237DE216|nr:tetratricopeptide repeat protein [Flavobacterium sp. SUN052]MEC4003414.1 tetratricopeptide repeat protein [Flavobacterium sp. SUN052]